MAERDVVICGLGLITPVGLTSAQTAAEIRAGTSRCAASVWQSQRFADLTLGLIPEELLPPIADTVSQAELSAVELRLIRLGGLAVREACAGRGALPGYLALREGDGLRPLARPRIFSALIQQAQHPVAPLTISAGGRAGGLQALAQAASAIRAGDMPNAMVCGVDTWADAVRLAQLEQAGRLTADGVRDGMVPGEGAACVVLAERQWAATHAWPVLAVLRNWATGDEPGFLGSGQANQGVGLSEAVRQLAPTAKIGDVYSTATGEAWAAREWGICALRQAAHLAPDHGLHHPAEAIGDSGAAAGLLAVGLATLGIRRGYRRSPTLVIAMNDGPARAAVLVEGC